MKITKVFCDICDKECDKRLFGVVSGCVAKMDETGAFKEMVFEGYYCSEDIVKILEFIQKCNEFQRSTRANNGVEQHNEGEPGGE